MKALAAGVQPALQVQLNLTSNSLVKITVSSPTNDHNPAVQHSNQDDWHSTPEPCTVFCQSPEAADHRPAQLTALHSTS